MYDISKFFDWENLIYVLGAAYKRGVQGRIHTLLFELDKNTIISAKTPLGLTQEADTGEGFGQGTVEGAILSANNLDEGMEEYFPPGVNEIFYGNVCIKALFSKMMWPIWLKQLIKHKNVT